MKASFPVAALTILGILLAVLGLFVGGSVELVVIGLLAIGFAGILEVVGSRQGLIRHRGHPRTGPWRWGRQPKRPPERSGGLFVLGRVVAAERFERSTS